MARLRKTFKAEKSSGGRFFISVYSAIDKRLRIDPVMEGALLQKRIEKLFWGEDFLELMELEVRE